MNGTAKYRTETSIETSSSGSASTPRAIHSFRPARAPVSSDVLMALLQNDLWLNYLYMAHTVCAIRRP